MKKNSQTLLEELNQQMKDKFEQHMCDFLNFKKEGQEFQDYNNLQNSEFSSNFEEVELYENVVEQRESHGTDF